MMQKYWQSFVNTTYKNRDYLHLNEINNVCVLPCVCVGLSIEICKSPFH